MFLWRSFVRELRNLRGCIDSVQNSSIFLVLLFIAFVSLSCNIFRHISCGLGVCGELGPAAGCMGASHKVKFITFFVSSNVIDFLGPLVACVDCACFGLEIMIFHF